jgi:hypothetical protein
MYGQGGYGYGRPAKPEESIYNLIPQEEVKPEKPPMYRSKYPADTAPTGSTFGRAAVAQIYPTNVAGDYELSATNHRYKQSGANFGPKHEFYSDPTNYLRKSNKPLLPPPKKFEYTDKRMPSVKEVIQSVGEIVHRKPKNFIVENALSVVRGNPTKDASVTAKVDPPNTNYLKKMDYGKVPGYLNKVKKEVAAEKEYIAQAMAQEREMMMSQQPQMRLLPEEERVKLLNQLKLKWENVNKQYQTMTHLVSLDTIGKTRRKEDYESQLQQLEKSIDKLSKKFVFVQDNEFGY